MNDSKLFKFVFPSLIGFLLLYMLPFILGVSYSFLDNMYDKNYVGFHNYFMILSSGSFQLAMRNTVIFMVIIIPLNAFISLIFAVIDSYDQENFFFKFAIIFPIFVPSTVVSGFFNYTLKMSSITESSVMIFVAILFLWRNVGFGFIVYYFGLKSRSTELEEAAKIDGASEYNIFRFVTMPLLTPYHIFVFLITSINSLKIFKDIYALFGSYPNVDIYMIQNYLFNKTLSSDYPELVSAAVLFLMLAFVIIIATYKWESLYRHRIGEK